MRVLTTAPSAVGVVTTTTTAVENALPVGGEGGQSTQGRGLGSKGAGTS